MAVDPTLQKIYEALEEHVKTGALDKLNDAPPVAAITGSDSGGSKFMSRSDVFEMRGKMLTKSEPELMAIWGEQSARRDAACKCRVGCPAGSPVASAASPSDTTAWLRPRRRRDHQQQRRTACGPRRHGHHSP